MKKRKKHCLRLSFEQFQQRLKEDSKVFKLFDAFIDNTIAYNDLIRLTRIILQKIRYRISFMTWLGLRCEYFLDMINMDCYNPIVCEDGCFKCNKIGLKWEGYSGNMDEDAELEMLISFFLDHEISPKNLRRLLTIIMEDDKAYKYCTFSLWLDKMPFMKVYFEGREVRRN